MGSGELSRPRPPASPPLAPTATPARAAERAGRRRRERPSGRPSEQFVAIHFRNSVEEEMTIETLNAACALEIFREELSERALARKFMWEFFD